MSKKYEKEMLGDPIVDHGICPRGKCSGRLVDDKCSECGWTEQDDLDAIMRYTQKVFPHGVDDKARAARDAVQSTPMPTGVPGYGTWALVAREEGNGVLFDTQVMQVAGGCIVRTLMDGMGRDGEPSGGSSMVFVPGAKLESFYVQEDSRKQESS